MRPLKIIYAIFIGMGLVVGASLIRAAVFNTPSMELRQVLAASKIFAGL